MATAYLKKFSIIFSMYMSLFSVLDILGITLQSNFQLVTNVVLSFSSIINIWFYFIYQNWFLKVCFS